jgi:hypothetical protein
MKDAIGITHHTFTLITTYLEDSFSLEDLLQFIAGCRGKERVLIEEQVLPTGITGFCFAFQDVDLIVVRQGLDPVRHLAVCLHECAHFLLRHVPRLSAGPTTGTFAEFVEHGQLQHALYRSTSVTWDQVQEQDAEVLATLLMPCVENEMNGVPQIVKDVYGYRAGAR